MLSTGHDHEGKKEQSRMSGSNDKLTGQFVSQSMDQHLVDQKKREGRRESVRESKRKRERET